jgi:hypothetical protein
MASQPQTLTVTPPRSYTRTDFTALRAFVQRIPASTIARSYYDADLTPHAATPEAMERYLRAMSWCSSRCCTARRSSPII